MTNAQTIIVPEIRDLLQREQWDELKDILAGIHAADIAEIIHALEGAEEKVQIFKHLDDDTAVEVFEHIEGDDRQLILPLLPQREQKNILNEMSPDERADFFDEITNEEVQRYTGMLNKEAKEESRLLASYPPDSAGGIMTTDFVTLSEEMTVAQALKRIREDASDAEQIYSLYVVNAQNTLVGIVTLKDVILANPNRRIGRMMEHRVMSVNVEDDQEEVANLFKKYDLNALPVVDKYGTLIGVITVDDVIDVIGEEDTEDIYRFGGVKETEFSYFQTSAPRWARQRITWLLLLVITGFISGFILERYEEALTTVVMLAFFIPVLMDSGGNAGTQSATVIVRGLATGEITMGQAMRVLRKEVLIALMVGVILAVLTALRAVVMHSDVALAATVAIAMLATVTVAKIAGAMLPMLFKKLGFDPAIMSGPFITTIVDIFALILYFELARLFLGIS
jgi:magnesium transporter